MSLILTVLIAKKHVRNQTGKIIILRYMWKKFCAIHFKPFIMNMNKNYMTTFSFKWSVFLMLSTSDSLDHSTLYWAFLSFNVTRQMKVSLLASGELRYQLRS